MTGDAGRAGGGVVTPRVDVSNVFGVLRLGYGRAGRHLPYLLVPVVLVLVPVGVVLGMLLLAVVGHGGVIVDGDLTPVEVSPVLVAVIVAVLVVWFAACLVVLAAMVVMSAGLLLGRPVRSGAALKAVARRPVAVAVLGIAGVLPGVLSLVAGVAVLSGTGSPWPAGAVAVVVLVALLWLVHGLPVAFLEGRGVWGSLGRAWSLTRQRRTRDAVAVILGFLAGPALFTYGVQWALSPLTGTAHTVLGNALTGAAGLLVIPFPAMTLAAATLNRQYPYGAQKLDEQRPLDPGPIAARLAALDTAARPLGTGPAMSGPATGDRPSAPGIGEQPAGTGSRLRPWWAVGVVAALVLPGLLYGGFVRLNPLGLPADHVIKDGFDRFSVALRMLPGDRPVVIDDTYLTVRTCGDPGCRTNRKQEYSELMDHGETGSVVLPGGGLAATAWFPLGRETPHSRPKWGLRMPACGTGGCGGERAVEGAPIVARAEGAEFEFASAMTATRDGIWIATLEPGGQEPYGELIRLIRCADIRCAAPRAVTLARLPDAHIGLQSRPLAIAAGPDGRPVVAYEDSEYGGVTVIGCDSTECHHPRTARPVPPARARLPLRQLGRYLDGIDVEVPPDGKPVLTFQDVRTGTARLLHCRTTDCAQTTNVALTGPDPVRSRPALALDHDGRPLVATYDHGGVELIACRDAGCAHRARTALAGLEHGPGYLDLALARDGRPLVLWSDELRVSETAREDGRLHLTTCARPRCGLP